VESSVFRGIQGAALGSDGSVLALRGLRIADCRSGLVARGGSLSLEAAEICRLHRQGIELVGVKGKITGTAVRGALRQGISVDGEAVEMQDVLIHECGVGLSISGGAKVRASRLTVTSSAVGISGARAGSSGGEATGAAGGGGYLDLSSGVLWPDREPLADVLGLELKLSDCIAGPPGGAWQAPDVPGLRLEKPAFAAPEKQDFKLRSSDKAVAKPAT